MTPTPANRPLRVAIVDDFEIVVKGLSRMCEAYPERIVILEVSDEEQGPEDVDLALFDLFAQQANATSQTELRPEVAAVRARSRAAKVVVYSWQSDPRLIELAMEEGMSGFVGKHLPALDLIEALERIHAGELVTDAPGEASEYNEDDWPGKTTGLTHRESEIITLITQGLSNQEIADRAYLSINSVKSYIRSSYRKIGVASRSQAVLWGVAHGFRPDYFRARPPVEEE